MIRAGLEPLERRDAEIERLRLKAIEDEKKRKKTERNKAQAIKRKNKYQKRKVLDHWENEVKYFFSDGFFETDSDGCAEEKAEVHDQNLKILKCDTI